MNAWIASCPANSRWRTIFLAILFEVSALAQSGGTVSGQIRLPDGSPAAGVRVGAMAVSVPGETGDAIVLDRIATTDSTGRYRLRDISPGRYYIVAGALAAPTFHSTILTIEPGSNATAVDFTIPRIPLPVSPRVSTVSPVLTGKVVMENGAPPPFFLGTLYVYPSGGTVRTAFGEDGRKIQRSGTAAAIPVGRNGGFSLPLQDGEYSISLITSTGTPLSPSDGYYVKSMTFGTTNILGAKFRVAGSSPSSITITLAAGK